MFHKKKKFFVLIFCTVYSSASAIINQFRYKNIDLKAAALNCILNCVPYPYAFTGRRLHD